LLFWFSSTMSVVAIWFVVTRMDGWNMKHIIEE
jgi:hypothetical protein